MVVVCAATRLGFGALGSEGCCLSVLGGSASLKAVASCCCAVAAGPGELGFICRCVSAVNHYLRERSFSSLAVCGAADEKEIEHHLAQHVAYAISGGGAATWAPGLPAYPREELSPPFET